MLPPESIGTKAATSREQPPKGPRSSRRLMLSGVFRLTRGSASNWQRKGQNRVMFFPAQWHCFMHTWVRRTKLSNGWKQHSPSVMPGCVS